MAWICSTHGICPDQQRECEDCEHFSENNMVHWTDDKDTITIVKGLQAEIEKLQVEIESQKKENGILTSCNDELEKQRTDFAMKIEKQRLQIGRLKELLNQKKPN